ncbi:Pkinase domain-containing protein/S_locus_glycop domain-containing protein/B_lectin domain-containing protein [Cephalotus follicularis]|uniref:Receptor-like serine/threonine-protein kinase n=1 Tax=Cephalotus follicularis TaxID=3775 RepID=A0A1Q3C304_CEPFO|nr:Pkinase domain-containing protein/S_locus_glycop domain-containing protein/B_lectin domain-containing protein [Cephalotus follicularis]
MTKSVLVLILSLLQICALSSSSSTIDTLKVGSSISVEKSGDALVSKNGVFSAGFHAVGVNAASFAIWFTKASDSDIVWMANRDKLVNGRGSKLSLLHAGNLILVDGSDGGQNSITLWAGDIATSTSLRLQLLNTGNLVLWSNSTNIVWQSFDSPTDTLLPQQALSKNTSLTSSTSETDYFSGYYKLRFDTDNILRLIYDGPDFSSPYWPEQELNDSGRSRNNFTRIMTLDSLGHFSSSDYLEFSSSDIGIRRWRRLKLDFDGILRVYSLEESSRTWIVSWQAISQSCAVRRSCGPNSLCSYLPDFGKTCTCLPGYKVKDSADLTSGCELDIHIPCNGNGNNNSGVGFLHLAHVDFYGFDMAFYYNRSLQDCIDLCMKSCDCKGFRIISAFEGVYVCYLKNILLNGYYAPTIDGDMYAKLPEKYLFSDFTPQRPPTLNCSKEVVRLVKRTRRNGSVMFLLWFAIVVGCVEMICIFMVWCFLFRNDKDPNEDVKGYLLVASKFRNFSYAELKKATRDFSEEIGRGAGGIVYKGILSDQRVAAIKRLNEANQGEAEFLAEVGTIGRLNHMNLIDMWGFCAEGKHRLLVYEYMEHGSLAKNLAANTVSADKRFEIAIKTARGLAYLHEECLEWILHCDVKPQNILLDSNYNPKVADFGLSKLLNRGSIKDASFSRMRGTRGYMAPEWVFNLPITSKVDVYSYGIVVLELVTGYNPTGSQANSNGEMIENKRVVTWVREKMKEAATRPESLIEDIIDPRIRGACDIKKMEILVRVALQCVEEDKDARPTMSQVVEMLLQQKPYLP